MTPKSFFTGIILSITILLTSTLTAVENTHKNYTVAIMAATSSNIHKDYIQTAYRLGADIATSGWSLKYGAADFGLMGAVAQGYEAAHGPHLIPVLTKPFFENPIYRSAFSRPQDQYVMTEDFLDRLKTFGTSNAIIVLPGGFGTLGEAFIFSSLAQIHEKDAQGTLFLDKPIVLINLRGFWDHMIQHYISMVEEGFATESHLRLLRVVSSVEEAMLTLKKYPQNPAEDQPLPEELMWWKGRLDTAEHVNNLQWWEKKTTNDNERKNSN